jgi:hypothetical protein
MEETVGGKILIGGWIGAGLIAVGEFYYSLRWLMLLALVLIFADAYWGRQAARIRGEKLRYSRTARRSANKAGDYFYWITIAGLIQIMFADKWSAFFGITVEGVPIIHLGLLIFIYSIEINSCYTNFCDARGIKDRWKFLSWISRKTSIELEEKTTKLEDEK